MQEDVAARFVVFEPVEITEPLKEESSQTAHGWAISESNWAGFEALLVTRTVKSELPGAFTVA